jgi:hypothetical protein
MFRSERVTTAEIQDLFAAEVAAAGGAVSDVFHDGRRLFARSLFPWVREVRTKDRLQGGVALRATERECSVHPFVFREVCRNGAIMAHSLGSQEVPNLDELPLYEATQSVREAIAACCIEEPFLVAVDLIREAARSEIDTALALLPFLSRLPAGQRELILDDVMQRFSREGDRTSFGLMNAVTSLARDTRDPDLRWRLEELGGGVAALRVPEPQPDDAFASVEA